MAILTVTIYEDASETHMLLATDKAKELTFETQLPGGFSSCAFRLNDRSWTVTSWYRRLLNTHVVIFDQWGRRCYEGRVEDLEVSEEGIKVSASGYYSHGADRLAWLSYPKNQSHPVTIDHIIRDAVDLCSANTVDETNTIQLWRQDYSFITKYTTDIAPQEFIHESKVHDMITKALSYGSDSSTEQPPRLVHFALWDNRVPHLFTEEPPASGYDWATNAQNVSTGFSMSKSTKDIYNNIQAVFDDEDIGETQTDYAVDMVSVRLYGQRDGTLNVGGTLLGVAETMRDLAISIYAYPEQSISFELTGKVQSKWGVFDELYLVRAGQYIRINDLDASVTEMVANTGGSNLSTAFINRTTYNADDDRLSIEVGHKNVTIDLIMARLGLGGGGVS